MDGWVIGVEDAGGEGSCVQVLELMSKAQTSELMMMCVSIVNHDVQ